MTTSPIKRLAITMGEPAGVGPELIVRLASQPFPAQLVVIGCPHLLQKVAKKIGVALHMERWQPSADDGNEVESDRVTHQPGLLQVYPVEFPHAITAGRLDVDNSRQVLSMLAKAGALALSGAVDAIVTAPVHKAILDEALLVNPGIAEDIKQFTGGHFSGHTEFFQQQAGVDKVVMMLATDELRIGLATTHLPLKEVSAAITRDSLTGIIKTVDCSFKQYGLARPKIALCGLNPHAGESGLLGQEEADLITPLIAELSAQGLDLHGPFPADTLFTQHKRDQYDFCLAMYHDQGLPVVKALGFGRCANITLGLPYIRTSVDHGTALDIAPQYCADESSLRYACGYALALAEGRLPGRH